MTLRVMRGGDPVVSQRTVHVLRLDSGPGVGWDNFHVVIEHQELGETLLAKLLLRGLKAPDNFSTSIFSHFLLLFRFHEVFERGHRNSNLLLNSETYHIKNN